MSSGSSTNDQNALNDVYDALGLPDTTPKPVASTSTSTIMDIPPAEDPLLRYITSSILQSGRRAKAARITSNMLLHIHAFTRAPPLPIVRQAIVDAAPAVRTLMHKRAGKVTAKPVALSEKQRTRYAIQAILAEIESQPGRLEIKLAKEMIAILQGTSKVLKKKLEQIHQVAMVNRYVVKFFVLDLTQCCDRGNVQSR
jgi:small subunit ribosomal protein S7